MTEGCELAGGLPLDRGTAHLKTQMLVLMVFLQDHAAWTSHALRIPLGPVNWQFSLNFSTSLGPPQITWNKFIREEVLLEPEKCRIFLYPQEFFWWGEIWNIFFKSLLNLLQYCFSCLCSSFFDHEACGILASQPKIEPTAASLEDCNHWIAWEVPRNIAL